MTREKDLVEAELVDCMQDIVSMYRDGAALELETADVLEKITNAITGTDESKKKAMDESKIFTDLHTRKTLSVMRKSELTEKYSRLMFEYLMALGPGKPNPFAGLV